MQKGMRCDSEGICTKGCSVSPTLEEGYCPSREKEEPNRHRSLFLSRIISLKATHLFGPASFFFCLGGMLSLLFLSRSFTVFRVRFERYVACVEGERVFHDLLSKTSCKLQFAMHDLNTSTVYLRSAS